MYINKTHFKYHGSPLCLWIHLFLYIPMSLFSILDTLFYPPPHPLHKYVIPPGISMTSFIVLASEFPRARI